jgi:hypothetical protein
VAPFLFSSAALAFFAAAFYSFPFSTRVRLCRNQRCLSPHKIACHAAL